MALYKGKPGAAFKNEISASVIELLSEYKGDKRE
jgi:hypothetical protein